MDTTRDEQLRQRAYRIWESEGRPDGMQAEHWARAERELTEEEAGTKQAVAPASRSRQKASSPEKSAAVAAVAPVKKKAAPTAPKVAPRKKKD